MKTHVIEMNIRSKFQQAEMVAVATVKGAKSKIEAIEAFRFKLRSSLNPVGKEVEIIGQVTYAADMPFKAYEKA